MFELCMSGNACKIFLRSSLAHTMNAFIGRLMCSLLRFSSRGGAADEIEENGLVTANHLRCFSRFAQR